MTKRILQLVSALVLVSSVSLSASKVEVDLVYPKNVVKNEVKVTLHDGYPLRDGGVEAHKIKELPKNEKGEYIIANPGIYTYWVRGEGYYNICKLFNVSEEDIKNGKIKLSIDADKLAKGDYQPSNPNPQNAPKDFAQDKRDALLTLFPDEVIEEQFSTKNLEKIDKFVSPYFNNPPKGKHQFTSQEDMMKFINDYDKKNENMYVYSIGSSPNYKFDIPLAIYTTTKIPKGTSLEEAANLVRGNGKLNYWIQSQIHSNEPASGEGTLVLMDKLTKEYGKNLMEKLNIIVVPRINVEGAPLFTRTNHGKLDMNRDHMILESYEATKVHEAYALFEPEIVVDHHEFTGFRHLKDGYLNKASDLLVTAASSLNNPEDVNQIGIKAVDELHADAEKSGLRSYHYGVTVNNAIGRAFYGLDGAVSVLVETRGIGLGADHFERRVYAQMLSATSLLDYALENSETIKKEVKEAREEIVLKGREFDKEDKLILHQVASGKTLYKPLNNTRLSLDGKTVEKISESLSRNDTILRSRIRPTAYVVPSDMENVDKLLHILDSQDIEYFKLGSANLPLEQYYYVEDYRYDKKAKGVIASLREEKETKFANGALVIPMDQDSGTIVGMLMEPDVNDTHKYKGNLVQMEIVSCDDKMNYPIYRYTKDNPRMNLKLK